uniref:FIP-RBD domain-containing protein n=1 Tax=Ditylenchus dipsaci TaxID=166011 RepID=A0A915D1J0_9BILA
MLGIPGINFNNLVIHVIGAKGLHVKNNKSTELYVSLSTAGKSSWKSKVTTNPVETSTGDCEWNEHCEFQLTDTDTEMHIHVNTKTLIGTTETLGQIVFPIENMSRYQPPAWFKLTKKHDENKDRGQIQLEYQFANKFASSISNFSINKIEKEKKFEKLKRKMHLIGKSKKATIDAQSMASVSLSRKSSVSSVNSGLAFSSPSPNQMNPMMLSAPENQITVPSSRGRGSISYADNRNYDHILSNTNQPRSDMADGDGVSQISVNEFASANSKPDSEFTREDSNVAESDKHSIHSESQETTKNLTTKMRHKAEQLLHLRSRKQMDSQGEEPTSVFSSIFHSTTSSALANALSQGLEKLPTVNNKPDQPSRPSSIASSSGFASLGSGNLGALNESTSPEHLLNVIKHLRKELAMKENRIRDMEQYTDKLLSKIILTHPELLQASPKPGYRQ